MLGPLLLARLCFRAYGMQMWPVWKATKPGASLIVGEHRNPALDRQIRTQLALKMYFTDAEAAGRSVYSTTLLGMETAGLLLYTVSERNAITRRHPCISAA